MHFLNSSQPDPEKVEHLSSLSTRELKKLRKVWEDVVHKHPGYWIAEDECELLNKILNKRFSITLNKQH
jgi:tagatose-1,6-bisphosphate aldolase non-catalytic subunit AgaZ/GatZ